MYRYEVKSYVHNKELLQASMMRIYSVIYGQCSDGIRAKIETMSNHETIANVGDTIGLLKNINSVMDNFQTYRKPVQSIMNCKKMLLAYRQGRDKTIPDYHKQFKELIDVIEYNGGSVGAEQHLYEAHLSSAGLAVDRNVTEEQRTDVLYLARDETTSYLFLFGVDKIIFGKLLEYIENDFTQGDDKFPTDQTHAYKLLANWKQYVSPRGRRSVTGKVSFANIGADGGGITGKMSFANIGGKNPRSSAITASRGATIPTTAPITG